VTIGDIETTISEKQLVKPSLNTVGFDNNTRQQKTTLPPQRALKRLTMAAASTLKYYAAAYRTLATQNNVTAVSYGKSDNTFCKFIANRLQQTEIFSVFF
jgi:hypothetical protein